MNFNEVAHLVAGIRYRGVPAFNVVTGGKYGKLVFLQHCQFVEDAKTGQRTLQCGRKWYISEYMTISEIVQTALMAVLAFEEHEARENFIYEGDRVFGPHINVRGLRIASREEETRE